MGWSHEFGSDSDTSEDANWVSGVVELGTIDLHVSSTGDWTSQWSDLRKSWWVEENEFETISDILVVEGKLKHDINEWWVEVVWWTLASGLGRRNNFSWSLSKGSEYAEGIVGVINVVRQVEWQEVISSKGNGSSATQWSKIWDKFLHIWVVVVPVLNILLRVLLSVQRDREWLSFTDDV
jgi:hypothetical protein